MKKKKALINALLARVFAAAALALLAGCQAKAPVIRSIHPQIGAMGEPVAIRGEFFGAQRGESYITIAGAQPTTMSYLKWQDDEIVVRMPEFGEAGLVYVYAGGKRSNGALFANQATLPSHAPDGQSGAGPRIISLSPASGSPGALVSISGTGFGSSRGSGGVFFPWAAQASAPAPLEARVPQFAAVSEADFGYDLWTDREIRIRVPDGASSGNMEVRTARGSSPPMAFDLSGSPGEKIFGDKRSYTLTFSVDVKVGRASAPNSLYLWIPRPASSAAQRNIELLSGSMEPFIDEYRGISLYKIDNLASNKDVRIMLSWKVDVYAVQASVAAQSVRAESNSPLLEAYTQADAQIPSGDPRVISQAAAILGRERNPYYKAQRLYEWMAGESLVWEGQAAGDVLGALESGRVDPYLGALLYCALLRAAGVPCQPVAGVLVSRNRQTMNHYWAEFWLDGLGWLPADPAMGAGAVPIPFRIDSEGAGFSFGNIDSQRIVFSRGFTSLSSMDPQGRTVAPGRSWYLHNICEEAVGGIESYSSLWGDITITGIYAQ